MLEKDLERQFCRRVQEEGGQAWKFVSPGKSGVPDRIVLFPGGRIFFVELKRPVKQAQRQPKKALGQPKNALGQKIKLSNRLRPLQKKVCTELITMGFKVFVISNKCQIEEFIREVKRN